MNELPIPQGQAAGMPDLIREETHRTIVRIVNILAGVTYALAFGFGHILYQMSHEQKILKGASIEAFLCVVVLILNYRKKLPPAILLTFFIHCASTLYFGLILGPAAQVQLMSVFLLGVAYLIFQDWPTRGVAAGIVVALLLTIELNYQHHFVDTVKLNTSEGTLRCMVISTVISLNCLMLYFVIREVVRYKNSVTAYTQQLQEMRQAVNRYVRESSHQMRIDLNVVYGIVQNSLAGTAGQEGSEQVTMPLKHLRAVYNSTQATIDHINNSLEWSRIEAGKDFPVKKVPFDLYEWLGDVTERFRLLAVNRPAHLVLKQYPSLPQYIREDRSRLSAIVGNLLSNAVKFTPKHTTVTVDAHALVDTLFIVISDQGKGIPKEEQARIFEPFVTEGSQFIQGTGLGLSVARQMARALGGDINVSSKEGRGTSFILRLPLNIAAPSEVEQANAPSEALEGLSVLIVEDELMSRQAAFLNLQRKNMQVYTCENGTEAMKKLAHHRIDVVLLDYNLPDSTGPEVTRWIRASPALTNIPIVILSAEAFKGDESDTRKAAFEAGANAYVIKPVRYDELYIEIEKLVRPGTWA